MANRKRSREDKSVLESAATLRNRIGDDETVPSQITFGSGKIVQIQTNTYSLKLASQQELYQYAVQFDPEILNPRATLHFVYTAICGENAGSMGRNERWKKVIYDERGMIYTTLSDLTSEQEINAGPNKVVTVKLTRVKTLNNADTEQLLQVYNIAFHKAFKSYGLTSFRQKWIHEQDFARVASFLLFKGYTPTIMNLDCGLSFVVDLATRIDREDTLYHFLRNGIRDVSKREELERACKSFQLQTTHLKKNKGVMVKRIIWESNPATIKFTKLDRKTKAETEISIADYFQDTYNHRCEQDDIIVVQGSGVKETFFPSSCLKATGISDSERRDNKVMRAIADETKVDTSVRKQKLDAFVSGLKSHPEANSFLSEWNIFLGESQSSEGNLIPPPSLLFCAKMSQTPKTIPLPEKLGFQGNLKEIALSSVPSYSHPCLIVCQASDQSLVAGDFVNSLRKVSKGLNLELPQIETRFIDAQNPGPNRFIEEIGNFIKEKNLAPSFVICALPTNTKQRYDSIKSFLTVNLGVPSQFFCIANLRQGKISDSVTTNVAIQIASKTCGVPYHVEPSFLPAKNVMLVGLAVTGGRMGAPVSGVIATYDSNLTQYISSSAQCSEKVADDDFLEQFFRNAIEKYEEANGSKPEKVVVYRDGVSYGQMPNVKKTEVTAIQNVLSDLDPNISFSFLIAQKHASIRIMQVEGGGKISNVQPGTVVTGKICISHVAEFYLVSHYANQGSANPTRYTMIHQNPPNSWQGHELITLTHYMALHYPNWPGSIRIPAVLMLAARLAEFSKSHLGSETANTRLKDTLYFL